MFIGKEQGGGNGGGGQLVEATQLKSDDEKEFCEEKERSTI